MSTAISPPIQSVSAARRRAVGQDIGLAPVQIWLALGTGLVWLGLCALAALACGTAQAQSVQRPVLPGAALAEPGLTPNAPALANNLALHAQVESLLRQQAASPGNEAAPGNAAASTAPRPARRVEVVLGQLDPRLRLAPCDKVRAYMPDGVQLWGKSRVGLRCEQGAVRWNVFWPVTVKVWAPALVATVPLRPGVPIQDADVRLSEVDIAASASPAVVQAADVRGRSVVHTIEPGQAIRVDDIRARRWFAAGEPVNLQVRGAGFMVASEGMALTPGDEGRCARVRTDSGRVVCALPVGERLAELRL